MKKKFVVLILSLLFINTIFAQSGLDLPFTSSKSGFTDSKTMLLKGPINVSFPINGEADMSVYIVSQV